MIEDPPIPEDHENKSMHRRKPCYLTLNVSSTAFTPMDFMLVY